MICQKVRSYVPYGTNSEPDAKKYAISFDKKLDWITSLRGDMHAWFTNFPKENGGKKPMHMDEYSAFTQVLKKIGFGHCGELNRAAFMEALEIPGIHALNYCQTTQGKHGYVVIGKRDTQGQWEPGSVICDAWAEKWYPVSQFHEMQKIENDIRFAPEYYREENLGYFQIKRRHRLIWLESYVCSFHGNVSCTELSF